MSYFSANRATLNEILIPPQHRKIGYMIRNYLSSDNGTLEKLILRISSIAGQSLIMELVKGLIVLGLKTLIREYGINHVYISDNPIARA